MAITLPAFCDNQECGAVFPSGFIVENCREMTFKGCVSGPCPQCGGMGHLPEGVFNFIEDTIEILTASQRTIEELTLLFNVINEAYKNKETPELFAEKIKNITPSFFDLLNILPQTRSEWYNFLALLLQIVAAVQGGHSLIAVDIEDKELARAVIVNQVLNQVYWSKNSNIGISESFLSQNSLNQDKVGRNDFCPCGSGQKFKKCGYLNTGLHQNNLLKAKNK